MRLGMSWGVSWGLRLGTLMLAVSGVALFAQTTAGPGATTSAVVKKSPGAESMLKAQKAFSNGKLKKALALYEQAAEADPTLYEAALFAGDTELKRKNYGEASMWFAKAIAINADRETAYRYWGDALMQKGQLPIPPA